MLNFNYKKICENLLKNLPQRTTEVLEKRFGLKDGKRQTLEAIGTDYGITRERVRQIIGEGISRVLPKIKEYQDAFQYFSDTLRSFGDFKKEDVLLNYLGGENQQNQALFLLTLGREFERFSEDDNFYSLWAKKPEAVSLAKKIVDLSLNKLQKEKKVVSLDQFYQTQKGDLEKVSAKKINKNIFHSCLEISKKIQKNPENFYGLRDWLEINPRGVKDKAYLVFKREGKPLHFAQVASSIEKLPFFSKKEIHLTTVHNELIKDPRFVLVGRGIYALKEWGYEPGVVKDIIVKILKEAKRPLSKEDVLEKVLKQRLVKENTVLLNLQDKNSFLRDEMGRYKMNPVKEA